MGLKNTILMVLVATLMVKEALATQYVVGGSQGWDQSTDFNSWTSTQTFKVGDKLVFKYSSMHNVVELSGENDYKTCNINSPVNTMSSGNDIVKLDKPGTRYFTCGTIGHCSQGMKMKITVANENTPSSTTLSPSSSSSSSSSSHTSTSTSTSTASVSESFAYIVFIFALVLNMFQLMM
ncbi:PREDICTED: mavicyanin-like [Lupinus angustifolius]|uniref:mavicyanin-like n=1 Tax=Lupinus angustifolius TaxID=3871 RepID=UPI00092E8A02|nr:PREDICTED: mavicyanin-like [Lupinus angustifolius]XP_019427973.1 PREDICTED: mavicyanin-like [Lupinus angustifolius]